MIDKPIPPQNLTESQMLKLNRQEEKCRAMPFVAFRLRLTALCRLIKAAQQAGDMVGPFLLAQQRMMNRVYAERLPIYRTANDIEEPEPVVVKLDDVGMNSRAPGLEGTGTRR